MYAYRYDSVFAGIYNKRAYNLKAIHKMFKQQVSKPTHFAETEMK